MAVTLAGPICRSSSNGPIKRLPKRLQPRSPEMRIVRRSFACQSGPDTIWVRGRNDVESDSATLEDVMAISRASVGHWLLSLVVLCAGLAGVQAADAPAELPRYRLQVGQELRYAGNSE